MTAGPEPSATLPSPTRMLSGEHVNRVVWTHRSDELIGYCWCGSTQRSTDPIAMWEWLNGHPDGHGLGEQGR